MVLYNDKGFIQQNDTTIIDTYAPKITAPKYKKILTDLKVEIDSSIIIIGDIHFQ